MVAHASMVDAYGGCIKRAHASMVDASSKNVCVQKGVHAEGGTAHSLAAEGTCKHGGCIQQGCMGTEGCARGRRRDPLTCCRGQCLPRQSPRRPRLPLPAGRHKQHAGGERVALCVHGSVQAMVGLVQKGGAAAECALRHSAAAGTEGSALCFEAE